MTLKMAVLPNTQCQRRHRDHRKSQALAQRSHTETQIVAKVTDPIAAAHTHLAHWDSDSISDVRPPPR